VSGGGSADDTWPQRGSPDTKAWWHSPQHHQSRIPGLILALNQLLPTLAVADKIYQGLLHYSFDQTPLPALAKSWTISPDGVVYTFNLEPRHRFWHSWTT